MNSAWTRRGPASSERSASTNQPLDGARLLASVYSGHQFGVWAGQLGDGRAILLGELLMPVGPQELQLKELAEESRRRQKKKIAERLRNELINHLDGISPILHTADRLRDGARWLRKHPQVFIAVGMAFIVARPRRALGWARRAFIGWQVWRRLRGSSAPEIFKKLHGRLGH